jgi:hypothetical protein
MYDCDSKASAIEQKAIRFFELTWFQVTRFLKL